jgi:hypothetical protein
MQSFKKIFLSQSTSFCHRQELLLASPDAAAALSAFGRYTKVFIIAWRAAVALGLQCNS